MFSNIIYWYILNILSIKTLMGNEFGLMAISSGIETKFELK
jgi:hypothetical protein